MRIPGQGQSPKDIKTMVKVYDPDRNAFVDEWKDMDTVRSVSMIRLNEMADILIAHYCPIPKNERQARDFIKGRISMDEATDVAGDDIDAKTLDALDQLNKARGRAILEAERIRTIREIRECDDPAECVRLSRDDARFLSELRKSPGRGGYLINLPHELDLRNTIRRYGFRGGPEEFRRYVALYGLEDGVDVEPFEGTLGDKLLYVRGDFWDLLNLVDTPTALDRVANVVHCLGMPVDRTGTLPSRLKFELEPIPELGKFSETFTQVADARAASLWAMKKPIRLFWSGGIDSTVALVALLKTAGPSDLDRLTVCYAERSITEYPEFWTDHIEGNLNTREIPPLRTRPNYVDGSLSIRSSPIEDIARTPVGTMIVTGECGDQVFGSVAFIHSPHILKWPLDTFLAEFSDVRDEIDAFNAVCPQPIETIDQMLWWWNFTVKWKEVLYRCLLSFDTMDNFENVQHFFNTDDWQRWSMSNPDKRGVKGAQSSYKMTAKEYIHAYAGHDNYRDEKLKVGSLRVRLGPILGFDNAGNVLKAGRMSTIPAMIYKRYGTALTKFEA